MVKLAIVFLAAVAGFLAAGSACAQKAERPAWRVGDAWTYRITTTYADKSKPAVARVSRQTIASVSSNLIEVSSMDEVGSRTIETTWAWNADGDVVSRRARGQAGQFYRPPIRFHQWPAEAGQRWSSTFDTVMEDGRRLDRVELSFHAVGWETVSVPAGKFRALKSVGKSLRPNTAYSSEAVSWFAPDAKRRVKLEERNFLDGKLVTTLVNELVTYTPAR